MSETGRPETEVSSKATRRRFSAQRRRQTFKTIPAQVRAREDHSPFRYGTLGRDVAIAWRSRLGRGLRRRRAGLTRPSLVHANPIFSSACSSFGQLCQDGVAGAEEHLVGRLAVESCMRDRSVVRLDVERDQRFESREVAEVVQVEAPVCFNRLKKASIIELEKEIWICAMMRLSTGRSVENGIDDAALVLGAVVDDDLDRLFSVLDQLGVSRRQRPAYGNPRILTQLTAPGPPTLCARPSLAFLICRSPPSPRSCVTTS